MVVGVAASHQLAASQPGQTTKNDGLSYRDRGYMLELVLPQVTALIDQDIATIALLLFVVLYLLMFPGGPGTPRRFRNPWEPVRVKLGN